MVRNPLISIVIGSFRRLDQLDELLAGCLRQDYENFEVVVVEQSGELRQPFRARLDQFARDPRVRILEYPPLGPVGARNEGVRQTRGEIVLFIDDDDLPLRDDWISRHAANFLDPRCLGVSGRQTLDGAAPTRSASPRARRRTLSYSFLKMPRGYVGHVTRIKGIEILHGTNSSIRKEAILRAGGWDETVQTIHENTLDFRLARVMLDGEYLVYDPEPVILRRLDIAGGVKRREFSLLEILKDELEFGHAVIRKYFPVRFSFLYPFYVGVAAKRTYDQMRNRQPEQSRLRVCGEVAKNLGPAVAEAWQSVLGKP